MSVATDLQTAVNRFTGVGSFPALPVDGQITPALGVGLFAALNWIHVNLDGTEATAAGLIAKLQNPDGSANLAQITASASGLASYLNDNADMGGLPKAPSSLLGLPSWVFYGTGAAALLGVLYWLTARGKKTAEVSGRRYRSRGYYS